MSFIKFHQPNGDAIHFHHEAVLIVHGPLQGPPGANALLYLSNGMQWHVKESVLEVLTAITSRKEGVGNG